MAYCDWDAASELMIHYHNEEWGRPVHEDRRQFEFLMMEAMQCGLNWNMMMNKREIFRACFDGFDFDKVAAYGGSDVQRILETPGMIRSRRKVEAVISNARAFQQVRREFGSFDAFIWGFSGGKTILYNKHEQGWIPVSNGLSDKIAKNLKQYGFSFVGTITVYSHLQACGIINDHAADCPCRAEIIAHWPTVCRRRFRERGVHFFGCELADKADREL